MFYTIRSDIQRAVLSRGFRIGALALAVVIILACTENLYKMFANGPQLPPGYHVGIITNALSSDMVTFATPIICALPFTPAFVDDMQSGFIKQFLPRCGINAYILGKLIACAISGGLVLFSGILLAYVLSTLGLTVLEDPFDGGIIATYSGIILAKAALYLCSGMLWSLVGFTLASITKSRYMAYAAPFVFYYILIILHERYFAAWYYLYPKEWLNPSHVWMLGNWGLILLQSAFMLGFGIIFAIFAKRKLGNG
ncbi:hypothetical protein EPA93_35340 [Ktedonosporobacter rubrisoli]|uniref:ABC transporter permease n=1 Tax=Ktedonosporobacter rubrisoli TaxID=2509675 RepID=A0A4P6JZN9_KTERU|nr:hypothetical protein [Ktedonosporobacter rubrisoli]QBD80962.1 hypothetical protein EPA93_35340 [Ktedonosporobacter rubrisoli]